ncbi:cupredoxin domain-containing protein [Ktedonobacter racemifer]|uniref:Blue (Type 1) copper domain protein n=1 Tax=Ktedonobacter racemifer DSM 44963 TaxID=485913 RepID=D6TCP2_KTERA|nr:plastocyanin/azurin family copper-binding protein [Ktedonobacter racemifer]EFH88156.1 blue (type 1) copper domain protein [Ktedonobacter racemifer DSM 44963]
MLRTSGVILALCSVIVLLLAACGTASNTNPASHSTENTVHMSSMQFVQSSITIKKGESVTLVADTITPHIIANGTWEQGKAHPGAEPGAPQVKDLQVAGNSSQTIGPFTTAGTFKLYCTIHSGMNLTVQVV